MTETIKRLNERYYLMPHHTQQKSFNNKAVVVICGNIKTLYSYDKIVASVMSDTALVRPLGVETRTTLAHVKEFLNQNGFKVKTKKDVMEHIIK